MELKEHSFFNKRMQEEFTNINELAISGGYDMNSFDNCVALGPGAILKPCSKCKARSRVLIITDLFAYCRDCIGTFFDIANIVCYVCKKEKSEKDCIYIYKIKDKRMGICGVCVFLNLSKKD